ncbi:MAG TPA: c-type cytochrome [Pyrinomonadaceae bacterium]|nr:c-type cytochrome [Pyrinomonadaceae bacterium]
MSTKSLCWCLAIVLLVAAALIIGMRNTSATPVPAATSPAACFNPSARIPLTGRTCGPVPDLQLSCYLPADMVPSVSPLPTPTPNFNTLQRSADIFSWQEFFALNWPAQTGMRGEPDVNKKINDPGPRVWETWKEEYEVYLKNGDKPKPWNDSEPVPGGCEKVMFRTQKIHDVMDATVQAAAADGKLPATLTDQKGKVVRYEIRLNKVLFDHVVQQRLYNAEQQALATSVNFPNGAILIKAAWREVSAAEEKSFHTVTACVCDKDQSGKMVNCRKQRMGLVGFHITQKTPFAPQWVWSTFEQINNVPGPGAGGALSFNNPNCASCPKNRQTRPGSANQIVRANPIPRTEPDCGQPQLAVDNIQRLNVEVRKALATSGSVFQYYGLINTQWPLPPAPSPSSTPLPETVFSVRPVALANTTMESFVQPTSTCMGCHSTARTVNPNNFVSSDFSFTLNNALPKLTSCKIIPPPKKPETAWDKQYWTGIMRGYALVTQTYELLPKFVPTAKLHCASCHLSAGGNSDAAWWVDLKSEYPTRPDLQARINHCFTNSLNGKALCTPASGTQKGNCDTDPNMESILVYMQWLDEQSKSMKLCNTVKHGYPPISTLTGNPVAGAQVFIQKCAVCHQRDGQGRYESNTYFRPALWGPHSFNQAAGMFSDPSFLAAFIRWNMPLMAGGELTDQEAWDVEAFIHSKPRPK